MNIIIALVKIDETKSRACGRDLCLVKRFDNRITERMLYISKCVTFLLVLSFTVTLLLFLEPNFALFCIQRQIGFLTSSCRLGLFYFARRNFRFFRE